MNADDLLLQTDIGDQVKPKWVARGLRYWSRVQVRSDVLFIVETSVVHSSQPPYVPTRFLTASFFEALDICKEYTPQPSTIVLYTWPTESSPAKRVVEKVEEAFGTTSKDLVYIKLNSGKSFLVGSKTGGFSVDATQRLFPL